MFLELYHNYQKLYKTQASVNWWKYKNKIHRIAFNGKPLSDQSINKARITGVQNNMDEFQMNYVKEKKAD